MRLIDGDRLEDVIEDECFNYSGESDFNAGIQNGLLIARDFVQEAPIYEQQAAFICTNCGSAFGGTGLAHIMEKFVYCPYCGIRLSNDKTGDIVKCKNCVYFVNTHLKKDGTEDRRCKPDYCEYHRGLMAEDDFCSRAIRKDKE